MVINHLESEQNKYVQCYYLLFINLQCTCSIQLSLAFNTVAFELCMNNFNKIVVNVEKSWLYRWGFLIFCANIMGINREFV